MRSPLEQNCVPARMSSTLPGGPRVSAQGHVYSHPCQIETIYTQGTISKRNVSLASFGAFCLLLVHLFSLVKNLLKSTPSRCFYFFLDLRSRNLDNSGSNSPSVIPLGLYAPLPPTLSAALMGPRGFYGFSSSFNSPFPSVAFLMTSHTSEEFSPTHNLPFTPDQICVQ